MYIRNKVGPRTEPWGELLVLLQASLIGIVNHNLLVTVCQEILDLVYNAGVDIYEALELIHLPFVRDLVKGFLKVKPNCMYNNNRWALCC